MEYTYTYVAQSSGVYGSDAYGAEKYSCAEGDAACQTTEAPNTGVFAAENTPILVGGFVAVVIIVTAIVYIALRKSKKAKA